VHYWQDWSALFDPATGAHLGVGLLVQTVWVVACTGICVLVLRHRDPAA
jgi:hypothetical protein